MGELIAPSDLESAIETFVGSLLSAERAERAPETGKAVHDAVWGTHMFRAPEMAIMDTPLFQRLRRIRQTSFAYLTYPSANHTRFEHSLGVVVMADRMLDALETLPTELRPTAEDRAAVRLAGLLHDVGHVFLSHIGEVQLKSHPQVVAFRKTDPAFEKPKTHELFSYIIVKSASFETFFNKLKDHYRNTDADLGFSSVKLTNVANYIIGKGEPERHFLADIINGNFDADKLDYFTRDSYFTGLRMSLDIDRLLHTMTVAPVDAEWFKKRCKRKITPQDTRRTVADSGCPNRLVVKSSGVSSLEQVLFAKMQLYASVYHHQKIRCADSMLSVYIRHMDGDIGGIPGDKRVVNPVDYLGLGDTEFVCREHPTEYLQSLASRLRDRDLPKRALVISARTVRRPEREGETNHEAVVSQDGEIDEAQAAVEAAWREVGLYGIARLAGHKDKAEVLRKLSELMVKLLTVKDPNHTIRPDDVVIDIPEMPSLREASETPVLEGHGNRTDIAVLNEYFPTDDWLVTYYTHKWHAHVFCPDNDFETRMKIALIAREVLEEYEDLGLHLTDEAWRAAHLEPDRVRTVFG